MAYYKKETAPSALCVVAQRIPDQVAVVDNGRATTYAQLVQLVERAGGALVKRGLKKGDRVAIWAPNSLEWIVGALAVHMAGGILVPLNTRMKGIEAQYILDKTRAVGLLTVQSFLGIEYPALIEGLDLPHLRDVILLDSEWDAFCATADEESIAALRAIHAELSPEEPSDILFTSGTTGAPKGVVCSHWQSVQLFRHWAEKVSLTQGDRYLIINPFYHTFGYKAGWLACLLAGATAYPMAVFDIEAVKKIIVDEDITVLPGPPTIFQSLLNEGVRAEDVPSLRLAVTGAASIPPVLIERMRSDLGIETVLSAYGLSESTGLVSLTSPDDTAETVALTSGRPVDGVELRIVDSDGQTVPIGETGEIWVRGINVMLGYFEDEAATAEAIDADGWLHTGDVGFVREDGCLRITDRLRDMFISGGFNCYPAEIEAMMMRHPDVATVAVIGVPDERLGEVGHAFVVPKTGVELTRDALWSWCRENMANYKVPRNYDFMTSLPLNASGKVLKNELRAQLKPVQQ